MPALSQLPRAAGTRDRYDPQNRFHIHISSGSREARLIREYASHISHPQEMAKLRGLLRKYGGPDGAAKFLEKQKQKGKSDRDSYRTLNWFLEKLNAAQWVYKYLQNIPSGAVLFGDTAAVNTLLAGTRALCQDPALYRAVQFLPAYKKLLDKAHAIEVRTQYLEHLTEQGKAHAYRTGARILNAWIQKRQYEIQTLRQRSNRLVTHVDQAFTSGNLNGVRGHRSAKIIADVGHEFWKAGLETSQLRKTIQAALRRAKADRGRIESRLHRYRSLDDISLERRGFSDPEILSLRTAPLRLMALENEIQKLENSLKKISQRAKTRMEQHRSYQRRSMMAGDLYSHFWKPQIGYFDQQGYDRYIWSLYKKFFEPRVAPWDMDHERVMGRTDTFSGWIRPWDELGAITLSGEALRQVYQEARWLERQKARNFMIDSVGGEIGDFRDYQQPYRRHRESHFQNPWQYRRTNLMGYKIGESWESRLDRWSDEDWERRRMYQHGGDVGDDIRAKYDPRYTPRGHAWFSVGKRKSPLAKLEYVNTAESMMAELEANHPVGKEFEFHGRKVKLDPAKQATNRLAYVAQYMARHGEAPSGVWKAAGDILSRIYEMNHPDQVAPLLRRIFHFFHPAGLGHPEVPHGATATYDESGEFVRPMVRPESPRFHDMDKLGYELVREVRRKAYALMDPSIDAEPPEGEPKEALAKWASKIVRDRQVNAWEQAREAHNFLEGKPSAGIHPKDPIWSEIQRQRPFTEDERFAAAPTGVHIPATRFTQIGDAGEGKNRPIIIRYHGKD